MIFKDLFVKLSPSSAGSKLLAQFYFEGLHFLMQKKKYFSTDLKVTRLNVSQDKNIALTVRVMYGLFSIAVNIPY